MTDLFSAELALVMMISIIINFVIVKTVSWHGRWTADASHGVQKVHDGLVPRIGGVSIFASLCLAASIMSGSALLPLFIVIAVPAFLAGFIEDLTKAVSPMIRLLAAMLAGFVEWMMGLSLQSVDIWLIDLFLANPAISLFATILVVAALANAINMIDGLNGLSCGYAIIVSLIFHSTMFKCFFT